MADQRPIGYWLKLVDRLIDESFEGSLDEHGVTRRQWQLLNVLGSGPASVEELDAAVAPFTAASVSGVEAAGVEAAGADVSAVSGIEGELAELVESDWVAVSPSGYVLTPRGQQSFERLSLVVDAFRASMSEGVGEADYATTVATLERMALNLGWGSAPE
ncbi:MAG: hypothetical protein RI885_1058 [Actinomycetota bacterium]